MRSALVAGFLALGCTPLPAQDEGDDRAPEADAVDDTVDDDPAGSPPIIALPVPARPVDAVVVPERPDPPVCPVDGSELVTVVDGTAAVVVVAAHAGVAHPEGCDDDSDVLRPIGERTCTPELDRCASGPCRATGPDRFSGEIADALVAALTDCLGARPALVRAETSRVYVDMNRDALDPVSPRCAFDDEAALPLWEAFHGAVADAVADAVAVADAAGVPALLLDVHTHGSVPAAPAPAVLLGAGLPFGVTLPVRGAADPRFDVVFGDGGLRARIRDGLLPERPTAEVWPLSVDGAHEDLFNGRYVIHHVARAGVDALQIEVSSGLREEPEAVAVVLARALCATLLAER